MGKTRHRPVCHLTKLQTSQICISSARSRSMENKRHDFQLDRTFPICISAMETDRRSTDETGRRSRGHDTDCTKVGVKTLVPSSSRLVDSQTNYATKKNRPASIASLRGSMQGPKYFEPTCLEIIRENANKKGSAMQ